jgi:hypothetical protein
MPQHNSHDPEPNHAEELPARIITNNLSLRLVVISGFINIYRFKTLAADLAQLKRVLLSPKHLWSE